MEKLLDELGFSKYKKSAYMVLVRCNSAKAGEISKKANIPTSKIYEVLDWLYSKGYISIISRNPLIYRANDPKGILKSELKSKIDKLKKVELELDSMKTLLPIAGKSDFQIIYGRDAFFNKIKETVSKSNVSIIAIVKNWRIDYELKDATANFVKNGGKARFLGPVSKQNKDLIKIWKNIGVLIKNHSPESTRFTVWDGKIITLGLKDGQDKEYYSLWIENEYLGKILTEYFNKIWRE